MALAPPRPCPYPRCPSLIVYGSHCPTHPWCANPRGSAHQRGYSTRWTAYAADWLVRFPWCGQRQDGLCYREHSACVRRGAQVQARVVDHIVSLAQGGRVFEAANHQSLCRSCNVVKG